MAPRVLARAADPASLRRDNERFTPEGDEVVLRQRPALAGQAACALAPPASARATPRRTSPVLLTQQRASMAGRGGVVRVTPRARGDLRGLLGPGSGRTNAAGAERCGAAVTAEAYRMAMQAGRTSCGRG